MDDKKRNKSYENNDDAKGKAKKKYSRKDRKPKYKKSLYNSEEE